MTAKSNGVASFLKAFLTPLLRSQVYGMSTANKSISTVTSFKKAKIGHWLKMMKEYRLESNVDNLVTTEGQVYDCGLLILLKD